MYRSFSTTASGGAETAAMSNMIARFILTSLYSRFENPHLSLQEPIIRERALQKPIEDKRSRDTESNGVYARSARWTCGSALMRPNAQVKPHEQAARGTTYVHFGFGIARRKPAACSCRLEPLVGRRLSCLWTSPRKTTVPDTFVSPHLCFTPLFHPFVSPLFRCLFYVPLTDADLLVSGASSVILHAIRLLPFLCRLMQIRPESCRCKRKSALSSGDMLAISG